MPKLVERTKQADAAGRQRRRFEVAGRFCLTVECADELSDAERDVMVTWLRDEACSLQLGLPPMSEARQRAFNDALAGFLSAERIN